MCEELELIFDLQIRREKLFSLATHQRYRAFRVMAWPSSRLPRLVINVETKDLTFQLIYLYSVLGVTHATVK